MENVNLIALAVPVFAGTVGLEAYLTHKLKPARYRFIDTMANFGCGLTQVMTDIFLKVILLGAYIHVFEHHALFQPPSWLAWVLALLGVDFFYYWWHRISHRVNFVWAAHAVHHQSQEYNLSVALRQSSFGSATSWIFYLPLALAGVPPAYYLTSSALSLLYQFWIHTRTIGKMGWFERWFNTPSHHRVHHAINPEYIDKNYAATLIVWDKMFGTFKEERAEPVYGTVAPFNSWNPIWANFYYWTALYRESKLAPSLADKFRIWWKPPGWRARGLEPFPDPQPVDPATFEKFDTPVAGGLKAYVLANYVAAIAGGMYLMLQADKVPLRTLAPPTILIIWGMGTMAGLMERRSWAVPLETSRLIAAIGYLSWWLLK